MNNKHLDTSNSEEIEGAAQGLGIAAASHLDSVLTQLTSLLKPKMPAEPKKKSWFSFGKKKKPETAPYIKNMVLRSWGWICGYCDAKKLVAYLDAHMTIHVTKLLKETQPISVQESLIVCINRIGRSLKKMDKNIAFSLSARDNYIKSMLDCTNKKFPMKIRTMAMECIATL
eukprot:UN24335